MSCLPNDEESTESLEIPCHFKEKPECPICPVCNIFVYGTLKRNQPNHHWINEPESHEFSRFVCKGCTVDEFPLVIATRYNFPFLLDERGCGLNVSGEVYEIDGNMLTKLDVLEDYPRIYDRQIECIRTCDNKILPCWVYILKRFPRSLLLKEFLDSYSSLEYPFTHKSQRDATVDIIEDLDYNINKQRKN